MHKTIPSFGRRNSAKHFFNPDSAELANQHSADLWENHIITDTSIPKQRDTYIDTEADE